MRSGRKWTAVVVRASIAGAGNSSCRPRVCVVAGEVCNAQVDTVHAECAACPVFAPQDTRQSVAGARGLLNAMRFGPRHCSSARFYFHRKLPANRRAANGYARQQLCRGFLSPVVGRCSRAALCGTDPGRYLSILIVHCLSGCASAPRCRAACTLPGIICSPAAARPVDLFISWMQYDCL